MSTTSSTKASYSWAAVLMRGAENAVAKNMQRQYDELCIIAKKNEANAKLEKIKRDNEYLQREARRESIKRDNERRDEIEEQYLRLKFGENWYVREESMQKLPKRCGELIELERQQDEEIEKREKDDQKRFDEEQARLKASMSPEEWKRFGDKQEESWMDEGSFQFGMQTIRMDKANKEREKEFKYFLQQHPGFTGKA